MGKSWPKRSRGGTSWLRGWPCPDPRTGSPHGKENGPVSLKDTGAHTLDDTGAPRKSDSVWERPCAMTEWDPRWREGWLSTRTHSNGPKRDHRLTPTHAHSDLTNPNTRPC